MSIDPVLRPSEPSTDSELDFYRIASRLRTDTWDELKMASSKLAGSDKNSPATQKCLERINRALEVLKPLEEYWAYPGRRAYRECKRLIDAEDYVGLSKFVARTVRCLVSDGYRRRDFKSTYNLDTIESSEGQRAFEGPAPEERESRPYFETLVVDDLDDQDEQELRYNILSMRREEDPFIYDMVVVRSFEDALIAVLFNHNIQTVVIRYSFPHESKNHLNVLRRYLKLIDDDVNLEGDERQRSLELGVAIKELRPELDLFLVTDAPVEEIAGHLDKTFRRVFYRQEDYQELHLSILKGINERFQTPFFTALKTYSQKPTGVFHAMPISRGKSISKSHWIQDMLKFYGLNIFLAETSATSGGLDSLLQPLGPLKKAQKLAARAFHAKQTFFVTNGTSTANKIVMQALVEPDDIVLVSRDCHKSHHYALILSGAQPVYLDSYPLHEYSMYGAVPLNDIKASLFRLKQEGRLHKAKMVLLTNCTFDGITYDPINVMEELLAIKSDLIFLWDEAWFAYASFTPTLRTRTGMWSARHLKKKYSSDRYREQYARFKEEHGSPDDWDEEFVLNTKLYPDPSKVRIRVYATQSTHKTLTALRQGSMIHIRDQDFEQKASDSFHEAYMTHTSTSPNYQILASLDVGRRQVELEGYEFVQKSLELSLTLREQIHENPLIRKYFQVLGPKNMIDAVYRPSGLEYYYHPEKGWSDMEEAWDIDEFVLDPTRITIRCGASGMDGDTFKQYLIDNHDIQINKTSRNTVLFMIHIGMTRGTVAHLIEVLSEIAKELQETEEEMNSTERKIFEKRVTSYIQDLPPLPNFSRFHSAFRDNPTSKSREGRTREAFFYSYNADNCEYLPMDDGLRKRVEAGDEIVSASFVTPYPPGFPVLVPGQILSLEILDYLNVLDVKEIHGYRPEYGLHVFTEEALKRFREDYAPPAGQN